MKPAKPQAKAAEWAAEVRKLVAKGMTGRAAVSALAKARPALRRAVVAEANQRGSR